MSTDGHGFFGMMDMRKMWRGHLVAGCLGLAVLAGCGGVNHTPKRDFNELIPRLMGAMKGRTPEDAAANLFNVTNPDERRDAIAYLQTKPYGHERPYMRAYELLTTDPSPMVRSQAMRALGTSHQQEAVAYLVDGKTGKTGLADGDATVREDAATGLGETFNDTAIQPLADHVRTDADDQVRINAARALGKEGTPTAIRALIDALDDKNSAVVFYAHESLVGLAGQQYGFDSKGWLEWYRQTYEKGAGGK